MKRGNFGNACVGIGIARVHRIVIARQDRVASRAAVAGRQAIGERERRVGAHEVADLGVIGQAAIDVAQCGAQRVVVQIGASRPDDGDVEGPRFAVDDRLRERGMLQQFAFHPFRRDVAAERGDEDVLAPTGDVHVAVGVDVAQVAGGDGA